MLLLILFTLCMIWFLWKMIGFAFTATWGIFKILVSVVLFPLFLIGLVLSGFLFIAFPLLVVVGLVVLLAGAE